MVKGARMDTLFSTVTKGVFGTTGLSKKRFTAVLQGFLAAG